MKDQKRISQRRPYWSDGGKLCDSAYVTKPVVECKRCARCDISPQKVAAFSQQEPQRMSYRQHVVWEALDVER